MELIIYIIIAIIWGIVSLIQKANKQAKTSKPKQKKYTQNNKRVNNRNEEEIFKELQRNIKNLKNYNDEVLRENTKKQDVYTSNYESFDNDREMLELQQKYNSKMAEINSIKEETISNNFYNIKTSENRRHINHMLSSLDIKNAIIYNAILEPKRINYMKIKR
ncbi:hypothetical protein N4239_05980 [Brachyspira hyodysenteriae]|uniref:hypothetical protein n=1 Tax=Brachyspira hyodysenteriae TaxID=159 RepID=UPI002B25CEB4|nr:hypothetical protein [Brachyspira hyodysenteriae]WPC25355.1 hypothetical protein N4239_05980 [Brachyspira hyodysenteriae]